MSWSYLEFIPKPGKRRARCVNHKHVIDSLVKKPQALRYTKWKQQLFPNDVWRQIWWEIDQTRASRQACRLRVGLLYLAAKHHGETELGQPLLEDIKRQGIRCLTEYQRMFAPAFAKPPELEVTQHMLADYDHLIQQGATYEHTSDRLITPDVEAVELKRDRSAMGYSLGARSRTALDL